MKAHSRISIQLVAFAAAVSAATAQTRPIFGSSEPSDLAWPPQWAPPGSFTRTAVGEFMGDGMRDVVTLAGTLPVIVANPAYYDWQHALPVSANDLDVATGAGVVGRDGVAVVNDTGLQLVHLSSNTPAAWTVDTLGTVSWKDASRIRCGNIDAASPVDYIGVAFDPTMIVRHLGGATTDASFHIDRPVVDLAFVQWDSDPSLEIALMYADGVDVFNSDGSQFTSPLASFQLGATVSMTAIAPAGNQAAGLGRIVVIHTLAGVKSLTTLSPTSPVSSTIVPPQTLTYSNVASGDVDGDGDGDLVITDNRVFAPFFLYNQSPLTPCFSAPDSWTAQLITDHPVLVNVAAANNTARPVFADLTGDGYADLLLPLVRTTTYPGAPMPAHLFLEAPSPVVQPPVLPAPALFRAGFQSGLIDNVQQRRAYLRIDMQQISEVSSGLATGVEVSVWRETEFGAEIDQGFIYRAVHPTTNVPLSVDGTIGIGIDFDDAIACFTNLYWIQVTPVLHTVSGSTPIISNTWHPFFGALATQDEDVCFNLTLNGEIRFWMDGFSPPVAGLPQQPIGCGAYSCASFGTTPAGAIIGRRRLPTLSSNTIQSDGNAPHVLALEDHTITY
jgi:hypothetical protein